MAVTEDGVVRVMDVIKELLLQSEVSGIDPDVLRPLESTLSTLSSPLFQFLVHLKGQSKLSNSFELKSQTDEGALQLESSSVGVVSESVSISQDSIPLLNPTLFSSPLDVPLPPPLSPLPPSLPLSSTNHSEQLQQVLVVKTQYQPRSVTLRKEEPTSLGLQIQGLSKTGLYVSDLPVGGMAERCGLLRVGDRLLSINETSCDNMASFEAQHLLQEISNNEDIVLAVQYDPTGLMDFLKHNKK